MAVKSSAKRKPKSKAQRAARESTTRYRTQTTRRARPRPRWKIPAVTPIGAQAPVSETLPLAVKRIAEALHPEKIILFGSYARGNPTPDSDVDLLVIMPGEQPEIERYLAVSRLLRPRPFAVDILVRTPQELRRSVEQGDFFMSDIISQGRVLYERSRKSA